MSAGSAFPPLSRDLKLPPGVDRDGHVDASIPYHRLYVGGLVSSLNEDDVKQVFEAFGELEFVDLHRDSVRFTEPTPCAALTFHSLEGARDWLTCSSRIFLQLKWRWMP